MCLSEVVSDIPFDFAHSKVQKLVLSYLGKLGSGQLFFVQMLFQFYAACNLIYFIPLSIIAFDLMQY